MQIHNDIFDLLFDVTYLYHEFISTIYGIYRDVIKFWVYWFSCRPSLISLIFSLSR